MPNLSRSRPSAGPRPSQLTSAWKPPLLGVRCGRFLWNAPESVSEAGCVVPAHLLPLPRPTAAHLDSDCGLSHLARPRARVRERGVSRAPSLAARKPDSAVTAGAALQRHLRRRGRRRKAQPCRLLQGDL